MQFSTSRHASFSLVTYSRRWWRDDLRTARVLLVLFRQVKNQFINSWSPVTAFELNSTSNSLNLSLTRMRFLPSHERCSCAEGSETLRVFSHFSQFILNWQSERDRLLGLASLVSWISGVAEQSHIIIFLTHSTFFCTINSSKYCLHYAAVCCAVWQYTRVRLWRTFLGKTLWRHRNLPALPLLLFRAPWHARVTVQYTTRRYLKSSLGTNLYRVYYTKIGEIISSHSSLCSIIYQDRWNHLRCMHLSWYSIQV